MNRFKLTVYEGLPEERVIDIRVGECDELFPDFCNADTNAHYRETYGYRIEVTLLDYKGVDKSKLGQSHMGIKDFLHCQAMALLRAASYGNGGFPLDYLLRK